MKKEKHFHVSLLNKAIHCQMPAPSMFKKINAGIKINIPENDQADNTRLQKQLSHLGNRRPICTRRILLTRF